MDPKKLLSHHLAFKIGGITLSISSDLPLREGTFAAKFQLFRCDDREGDKVTIRHHCGIPKIKNCYQK